jgi:hypothetical protein
LHEYPNSLHSHCLAATKWLQKLCTLEDNSNVRIGLLRWALSLAFESSKTSIALLVFEVSLFHQCKLLLSSSFVAWGQTLLNVKFPKKIIVLRCFLRLVWTQVQEDPIRYGWTSVLVSHLVTP